MKNDLENTTMDAVSATAHTIAQENRRLRMEEAEDDETTVVIEIPRTEESKEMFRGLSKLFGLNIDLLLHSSIHIGLRLLEQHSIEQESFDGEVARYHIKLPYVTYERLKKQELLDSATEIAMLGIKTLASRLEDVITEPQKEK